MLLPRCLVEIVLGFVPGNMSTFVAWRLRYLLTQPLENTTDFVLSRHHIEYVLFPESSYTRHFPALCYFQTPPRIVGRLQDVFTTTNRQHLGTAVHRSTEFGPVMPARQVLSNDIDVATRQVISLMNMQGCEIWRTFNEKDYRWVFSHENGGPVLAWGGGENIFDPGLMEVLQLMAFTRAFRKSLSPVFPNVFHIPVMGPCGETRVFPKPTWQELTTETYVTAILP